jgi:hypothetical protein
MARRVVRTHAYLFLSPFLLKTFSVNPFQGQYPNIAVGITATPMNPSIHPEIPEIKKAKAIKTAPMTNRKILSPVPTFIILTTNPTLSSR